MRKIVKTVDEKGIDEMGIDEMGINHEKMVPSNLCPEWRLRLSCASAQSDQSLCYPQKETCILSYPKCTQWRFGLNWANAQAAPNLLWEHMSEGTFSDVTAHIAESDPDQGAWLCVLHFGLEIHKRVTDKKCRPRSDVALFSIWSGSTLFANTGISLKHSNDKN